jgi:general secretion pathway protein H
MTQARSHRQVRADAKVVRAMPPPASIQPAPTDAKVIRAISSLAPVLMTDPVSIAERKAGFTLIEMQAVMLIIALVAALVFATMSGTGRTQLKAVALQTEALLRRERLGAILTARSREVSIDGQHRAFVGDGGRRVEIPRDVTVDILSAGEQWSGRQAIVRFLPDGTSSGAVVKLSREGAIYEVRVNWYTGSVLVEPQ